MRRLRLEHDHHVLDQVHDLVALSNGAGAGAGTLTNAPSAGNPTKWIPINDNGTTRYISGMVIERRRGA